MRRLFLGFGLAAALCAAVLLYAVLTSMGGASPGAGATDEDAAKQVTAEEGSLGAPGGPPPEPRGGSTAIRPTASNNELDGLLGGLTGNAAPPPRTEAPANRPGDGRVANAGPSAVAPIDHVADVGIHENLKSNLIGKGPLKNVFSNKSEFDARLNADVTGVADELVVGAGSGGLGLRGTGDGGGGEGFGRIHGMGKIDTGGGRGTKASLGGKKAARRKSVITRGDYTIEDVELEPSDDAAPEPEAVDQKSANDRSTVSPLMVLEEKKVEAEKSARQAAAMAEARLRGKAEEARRGAEDVLLPEGKPTSNGSTSRGESEEDKNDYGRFDMEQARQTPDAWVQRDRYVVPGATLPRTFYFENTYLGRNAGYLEERAELERRFGQDQAPWRLAGLPEQPIDPPAAGGLALNVALSETWVDRPQRVFLQVSLRGSERHGWRRPPLDQVVAIDARLLSTRRAQLMEALRGLASRLGPQDQVAVVLTGSKPEVILPLGSAKALRNIEPLLPRAGREGEPEAALSEAGRLLTEAAEGRMRVPGTGVVLWLAGPASTRSVGSASAGAHALTLQGAITSVIALHGGRDWWPVAQAGHGNHHSGLRPDAAVAAELDALSRVIARLLRINIRLGPDVEAIRVLGSRVLTEAEKAAVKAREVATDTQLSKTLGLKADRGDDDDGLQTVIPTFYGGDAHVILVELWVKKPGLVAEVSLRAKDMVTLGNTTAQASASLGATPRDDGPVQVSVRHNVQGFSLAEALSAAAADAAAGRTREALDRLRGAPIVTRADRALVWAFKALLRQPTAGLDAVADALDLSSRQRISHPSQASEMYR